MSAKWAYLETEPAHDAPVSDNPSGMYCAACRGCGLSHCSEPEYCGGMRLMRPVLADAHICGGAGKLSPAATAELMEFSRYLKEKHGGVTQAKTFSEWRAGSLQDTDTKP